LLPRWGVGARTPRLAGMMINADRAMVADALDVSPAVARIDWLRGDETDEAPFGPFRVLVSPMRTGPAKKKPRRARLPRSVNGLSGPTEQRPGSPPQRRPAWAPSGPRAGAQTAR
jgi:hypothetical protein